MATVKIPALEINRHEHSPTRQESAGEGAGKEDLRMPQRLAALVAHDAADRVEHVRSRLAVAASRTKSVPLTSRS